MTPDKPPDPENDEAPGWHRGTSEQHEQIDHSTVEQKSAPNYDYSTRFMMVPHPIWRQLKRKPRSFAVYTELLSRAAWTPGPRVINGRVVHLRAGQCVFGRTELARELGLTDNQVRTAILTIIRTGIITIKTTSQGTIATLLGYGENGERPRSKSPARSPAEPPRSSPENHQQNDSRTTTINKPNKSEKSEDPKKGKKDRERAGLPPSWVPSDDVWKRARDKGLTDSEIDDQIARFKDHVLAHGLTYVDTDEARDAALRQWLLKNVDYLVRTGEMARESEQPKKAPTRSRAQSALDAQLERVAMLEAKEHWDRWWSEAAGVGADWTSEIEAKLAEKIQTFGLAEVKHRFDVAERDPPEWPKRRDIETVLAHFDKFTRGKPKRGLTPPDDTPPLFELPTKKKWVPECHRKLEDNEWPRETRDAFDAFGRRIVYEDDLVIAVETDDRE